MEREKKVIRREKFFSVWEMHNNSNEVGRTYRRQNMYMEKFRGCISY
jgi:hypothetical protein